MNLLFYTHFLNGLLMVALPVGLGIFLTRKFQLGWKLWWIGAATFILSQVGHIPFNYFVGTLFQRNILPQPPEAWQLPFQALFLGLSSGLWEELARYAAYRWWAKDARSWQKGILMGAGHGGMEALILGLLVLLTFMNMVVARGNDLSLQLSPELAAQAQQQIQAYWSLNWYDSLMGILERLFTVPFHIAASLMVMQVFIRKQARWLWMAVAWHAMLNFVAVFAGSTWGMYWTELMIGGTALVNLGIIWLLRPTKTTETLDEPASQAVVPADAMQAAELHPIALQPAAVEETPENLDSTRFGTGA